MSQVEAIQVEEIEYRQQIETWRKNREDGLRSPDGWLSLAGLFILEEGEYSVGSDEGNQIVLPASAPATLGTLQFSQGKATLTVTTDSPVLADGAPVRVVELIDNRDGRRPTLVSVGTVSFFVHHFGNEYAIRVKDSASPALQSFEGCLWFEIDPTYRVQGKLNRQIEATVIPVQTVVQTAIDYKSVGAVEFELQGTPLKLLATATSKANEVFIILRDATSGRETYGASRYLYAVIDGDDNVILDFNKAYNPPCAFTPYATCTLPPRANRLPVAIKAGERI